MQTISLIFVFGLLSQTFAAEADFSRHIESDLLRVHARETQARRLQDITRMNDLELKKIESFVPERTAESRLGKRLNEISDIWAERTIYSIDRHPVVSTYQYQKYNRKDVEIGFCFGRATYAHLILLQMGINRDAIKKIWAVGPMDNGNKWQFHVATIVKAQDDTWYAIDNVPGRLVDVRDWANLMRSWNSDGTLRFYITEPEKFSVSLGKYSRVQMGLDLPKEQDWYQNYFVDLMQWFKDTKNTLESLGLFDLRKLARPF